MNLLDNIQTVKDAFTPTVSVSSQKKTYIIVVWIFIASIAWSLYHSPILPRPSDIVDAFQDLIENQSFLSQLLVSLTLCIKAMLYATILSAVIAYASVMAGLTPIMALIARGRFMGTFGLTFIFTVLTNDSSSEKTALLVFSITVFTVTSFMGIIAGITKDDYDYARTLKMNNWRVLYEVIIRGKAADFADCVRQNFAIAWMMLAMVENICRADGGIGVILNDQNKHFHMDSVYAIQITVLLIGIGIDLALTWLRGAAFPYSIIKNKK
jgi:ABC-type nitrate/sulfonate/bicarbonate transport system permease component